MSNSQQSKGVDGPFHYYLVGFYTEHGYGRYFLEWDEPIDTQAAVLSAETKLRADHEKEQAEPVDVFQILAISPLDSVRAGGRRLRAG